MIKILRHATTRLSVTLLVIVSLISIATPCASAFDGAEDKSKEGASYAPDAESGKAAAETKPRWAVARKSPSISYALYSEAMRPQPELILAADVPQLESAFSRLAAVKTVATRKNSTLLTQVVVPAASTAPLTPGEKFKLWAKRFISPGSYASAAASGLWNELLDNDEGKEDTVENYFADAATRAARSYAFGTTAGFFEKFAYASLFRQDPRYHRSDKRGLGGKMGYAVSRVFITQGDRCGCDQFNISFLAGGLTAAGISNIWEREERQTVGKTFSRWGTHIRITALTNIVREFIGGQ
ncbi:MAG TPA: hypothetical protein VJZ26_10640 [Blastocatellia bacterium]|nr:hypothetical protein [Blastocatellia bacterium]